MTSAAEVAAFDPAAAVRAFTPEWVMQLVSRQRLAGVLIDPAGTPETNGSLQIWHLLDDPAVEKIKHDCIALSRGVAVCIPVVRFSSHPAGRARYPHAEESVERG
ncbi:hypothetical protein [Arthrobacter pityocampae]|uniref:hypothetical protein n=1 Tax=Arthrobacter pityocampae TaxID=547334 RepID=UPI0011B0D889|nr:hypothetical protein [Arthrobacter pityocampae]